MENTDAPSRSSQPSPGPPGDREQGHDAPKTSPSVTDSAPLSAAIEPDFSTDDEGYAASTTTSYVTSIASDIRRGIEENGRLYSAYGMHKAWLPIDDAEVGLISHGVGPHELILS
jgi:hypothetical protein